MSRLEQLEKDNLAPDFPPFDGPKYLLDMFWEVGPTMSGGMGPGKLTNGEIESWQHNIGIKLTPWECRTLVRLSLDYLSESNKATKRDAVAPWQPAEVGAEYKRQVARNLAESMRRLAES